MRRHVVCLIAAMALSGCTAIFDLHSAASVDHDNDGLVDAVDNCPDAYNPDQSDYNHDGLGDVCDPDCINANGDDVDHDGIPDSCDGCIGNGMDVDGDNIDDACDICIGNGIDVDADGIADNCDSCIGTGADADHDGIDDACDSCIQNFIDADMDGIDDGCDPCVGPPTDTDHDGVQDACDPCPTGPQHDEDGDGHFDSCDVCPAVLDDQTDADGDGVGDACDISVGIEHHAFDPFTANPAGWYVQGASWQVTQDALYVTPWQGSTYLLRADTASSLWSARTEIKFDTLSVPPGPWGFGEVAVFAATEYGQPAATSLECAVDVQGNVIARQVFKGQPFPGTVRPGADVTLPFPLSLRVDDNQKTYSCLIGEKEFTRDSLVVGNLVWHPGVSATGAEAHFNYFDLVTP
jgi:hypothetical protein